MTRLAILTDRAVIMAKTSRCFFKRNQPRESLRVLVQLREYLNKQPELEAGGACESDEPSSGS